MHTNHTLETERLNITLTTASSQTAPRYYLNYTNLPQLDQTIQLLYPLVNSLKLLKSGQSLFHCLIKKPNKYFLFIAYSFKILVTDRVWNLEQIYFIFQGN